MCTSLFVRPHQKKKCAILTILFFVSAENTNKKNPLDVLNSQMNDNRNFVGLDLSRLN
jgi:hypothetical protein